MTWLIENWDSVVAVVAGIITVASGVTKMTASPKDDEILKKIVSFWSIVEHADVGGLKFPAKKAKDAGEAAE